MSYRSTTDTAENDVSNFEDDLMKRLRFWLKANPVFRFFAFNAKDHYRPEKFYMRGPGPKAKAKLGVASGDLDCSRDDVAAVRDQGSSRSY